MVEILVVIAIIGILAGVALRGVLGGTDKARIGRARGELGQIAEVVKHLEVDTGCWPNAPGEVLCKVPYLIDIAEGNEIWDLNDNDACITANDVGACPKWGGPYMEEVHDDPWGNNYFLDPYYDIDPDPVGEEWAVVIGSFGPNGVGQNIYDDDNVISVLVSP